MKPALIIGRRYRVQFEDCCVEGQAEGILLGKTDGDAPDLIFEWGRISGFGVNISEIEF